MVSRKSTVHPNQPRKFSPFSVCDCLVVTIHNSSLSQWRAPTDLRLKICIARMHGKTTMASRQATTAEMDDNNKLTCSTNAITLAIKAIASVFFFEITQYNLDTHNACTITPINTRVQTLPVSVMRMGSP